MVTRTHRLNERDFQFPAFVCKKFGAESIVIVVPAVYHNKFICLPQKLQPVYGRFGVKSGVGSAVFTQELRYIFVTKRCMMQIHYSAHCPRGTEAIGIVYKDINGTMSTHTQSGNKTTIRMNKIGGLHLRIEFAFKKTAPLGAPRIITVNIPSV